MSDTEDSDFDDDLEALAIQKVLLAKRIQEAKAEHQETAKQLSNIFSHLAEFLRKVDIPYRIVGGTAVSAWLNPRHQSLTKEQLDYVKTTDWDIEILGGNKEALELIKKISAYLEEKTGHVFDKRFSNIVEMGFLPGMYVYQLGIADGPRLTEWIIDVHGQKKEVFRPNETVLFDGLRYPNLKVLIEDIQAAIDENPGNKGVKRFTRKILLQEAIKDINRFNPVVFKAICQDCKDKSNEKMTGYNLDCKTLADYCGKK